MGQDDIFFLPPRMRDLRKVVMQGQFNLVRKSAVEYQIYTYAHVHEVPIQQMSIYLSVIAFFLSAVFTLRYSFITFSITPVCRRLVCSCMHLVSSLVLFFSFSFLGFNSFCSHRLACLVVVSHSLL